MEKPRRIKLASISGGNARSAAAKMIQKLVRNKPINPVEALIRLNPQQRAYTIRRLNGQSRRQASKATGSALSMDYTPSVKAALDSMNEHSDLRNTIKGSVMTLVQRRNLALDKLVGVVLDKSHGQHVKAIELLGKTAGLFSDTPQQSAQKLGNSEQIKASIVALLDAVRASHTVIKDVTLEGECMDTPTTAQDGLGDV